jgi:hypothetical protein
MAVWPEPAVGAGALRAGAFALGAAAAFGAAVFLGAVAMCFFLSLILVAQKPSGLSIQTDSNFKICTFTFPPISG